MDRDLNAAITNAWQYHMREAASIVPDVRDSARGWAETLDSTLRRHNADYASFLNADATAFPSYQAHLEFLTTLSSDLNPYASWFKTHLVSLRHHVTDVGADVGLDILTLRTQLETAMTQYTAALETLFAKDAAIYNKIRTLDAMQHDVRRIVLLDTPAAAELQTSILNYIASVYTAMNIKEDYEDFMRAYARMVALRSVVNPTAGSGRPDPSVAKPLCSICMRNELSHVCIPCGHLFCGECAKKQHAQCYICRTTITERHKIYFS